VNVFWLCKTTAFEALSLASASTVCGGRLKTEETPAQAYDHLNAIPETRLTKSINKPGHSTGKSYFRTGIIIDDF
jgi:hypothetical protein